MIKTSTSISKDFDKLVEAMKNLIEIDSSDILEKYNFEKRQLDKHTRNIKKVSETIGKVNNIQGIQTPKLDLPIITISKELSESLSKISKIDYKFDLDRVLLDVKNQVEKYDDLQYSEKINNNERLILLKNYADSILNFYEEFCNLINQDIPNNRLVIIFLTYHSLYTILTDNYNLLLQEIEKTDQKEIKKEVDQIKLNVDKSIKKIDTTFLEISTMEHRISRMDMYVRARPNKKGRIMGVLKKNQVVIVLEYHKKWLKVKCYDSELEDWMICYGYKKYLIK